MWRGKFHCNKRERLENEITCYLRKFEIAFQFSSPLRLKIFRPFCKMSFFAHHKNTLLLKWCMQFFIEKRMLIGLEQFSHALRDSESMHSQMFVEMFCICIESFHWHENFTQLNDANCWRILWDVEVAVKTWSSFCKLWIDLSTMIRFEFFTYSTRGIRLLIHVKFKKLKE